MDINYENLIYSGAWFGKIAIDFNDVEYNIELQIDGYDENFVPENAKEALEYFLGNLRSMETYIGEEILKYYNRLRRQLGFDTDFNEDYPEIKSAEDVLQLIELKGIIVPDQDDYDDKAVALAFDCSWDKENGLGICFEGNRIVDIGYQDVAL